LVKYGIIHLGSATSIIIDSNYFENFIIAAILIHGSELCQISNNYIYKSGCGILATNKEVNESNLLDFSGSNFSIINLLKIKKNYIIECNYGIILNFGSDVSMYDNTIAYSSTWALYANSAGILNIGAIYFEGNGHAMTWVDANGFTDTREQETIVPQLENGWGYITKYSNYNSTQINVRAIMALFCYVSIQSLYASYKEVRTQIGDNILNTYSNNVSGIDSLIITGRYSTSQSINNIIPYRNGDKRVKCIAIMCLGGSKLTLNSLPEPYYQEEAFLKLGGNVEAASSITIISKDNVNNIFSGVFDYFTSIETTSGIYGGNVYKYFDKSLKSNNILYLHAKAEHQGGIYFRFPVKYFFKNNIAVKIFCCNMDAPTASSMRAEIYSRIDGQGRVIKGSSSFNNTEKYNVLAFMLNYEDIEGSDYVDIRVNVNTQSADNIYYSIPYVFYPNSQSDTYTPDPFGAKPNKGTFAQATTIAQNFTTADKGYGYFATDKGAAGVGAMIYYTGDNTTPWVYADGTAVS
jgi:hypothetical protein